MTRFRARTVLIRVLAPGLVLAGTLAGALPAPASGTARGELRVLQLNLCGSGYAVCWTGRAVTRAAAVIRAQAPDLVTLNEICAGDLEPLRRALAAAPGAASGTVATAFAPVLDRRTRRPVRCRNGQPYGIGVVGRTTSPGAVATVSRGAYRRQDPGQLERRAWVCLTLAAPGTPGLTGCSTHLASGGDRTAAGQCHELATEVLAGWARPPAGRPVVVGGDLNLTGALPASCRPAGYQETGEAVQHVLARGLVIRSVGPVDLQATTDHPGLLAVLRTGDPGPIRTGPGTELLA